MRILASLSLLTRRSISESGRAEDSAMSEVGAGAPAVVMRWGFNNPTGPNYRGVAFRSAQPG